MNNQELIKKVQVSIDKQINKKGYATIVDILLDLGYLTKQNYEKWRCGQVPYLEKVLTVNLNKLSLILKTAHAYANKRKYKKSITFYKKYKSKRKIKLRFSASNNEKIEQSYSTHFVSNDINKIKNNNSKQNDNIVKTLKDIINEFGPDYLNNKPFEVFDVLSKNEDINRKKCSTILYFLLNNVIDINDDFQDIEALSKKIQNTCDLNSKISDEVAYIFSKLFSKENKEEFINFKENRLNSFLENGLSILWNGYSIWNYSTGHINCYCVADMVLSPTNKVIENEKFKDFLDNNPYASLKDIYEFFKNMICEYLDYLFDDFCNADKYYEPVIEDFDLDNYLIEFCDINGFEIISCDYDAYTSGYIADF